MTTGPRQQRTYGILSTETTMADRNLSVMVFMFLMEASSLVLTSWWLMACSGVTSYGSLLQSTGRGQSGVRIPVVPLEPTSFPAHLASPVWLSIWLTQLL